MVFSLSLTFKVINLLIPDCLELEQFSRSPLRTVFDVYFRELEDVYHQDRTWASWSKKVKKFGYGSDKYSRFSSRESNCTYTLIVFTNILKLSPTHLISSIRHQHRCNRFFHHPQWLIAINWQNYIMSNGSKIRVFRMSLCSGIWFQTLLNKYYLSNWILFL